MEGFDVVVCAKNNEATIRQSLQRILRYASPSRLIVIDGKSKDRTMKIALEMGAEVYSDEGKGLGYARSIALGIVRTPVLGFIDADALIPDNWLSLRRHMSDPSVAAASATTIYGYGSRPLQRLYEWASKTIGEDVGFVSTIVKRSVILEVGGIRKDLPAYEDRELHARLKSRGFKWISDPSVVTLHPQSPTSLLSHARRWGQGARKGGSGAGGLPRQFLTTPVWGIRLCLTVDPMLVFYYPMLRLAYFVGYVEGPSTTL